jgi:hypothetical protein
MFHNKYYHKISKNKLIKLFWIAINNYYFYYKNFLYYIFFTNQIKSIFLHKLFINYQIWKYNILLEEKYYSKYLSLFCQILIYILLILNKIKIDFSNYL